MTIDELKARKRELMARKKYELELQERGEGDNFALFMVNEELLDVNAQLRAIVRPGRECTSVAKDVLRPAWTLMRKTPVTGSNSSNGPGPMWMTLLKRPEPNSGRCCTVG